MKMKILLWGLWLVPGWVQAQAELDLARCRELALKNSKALEISESQWEKARFEMRLYQANYFPELSVVGFGLYHQKKYEYKVQGGYLPVYKSDAEGNKIPDLIIHPGTGKPVAGAGGTPLFHEYAFLPDIGLRLALRGVYTAGIRLEQPLYMGGKVRAAYLMAKAGEAIAGEQVRYRRSEVVLETDRAYWRLLRLKEQVGAALKYRETVKELLKNLRNARQVGMSTANDVLKVQVRYNEADLMVQQLQNGETLARMNLCRIVGFGLQTPIRIRDSLSAALQPRLWQRDSSVVQRPDYRILKYEVDLKGRQAKLVRSDYLPQIGVSAGYGYGGGLKLNGQAEEGASFTALASVRIPLFHWGEGRNKIRSAKIDREISRLSLEESVELMRLEIAAARFRVRDAETRVVMARHALDQARENLKVSGDRFQVGMESLASLLEAQAQWQQAWSQWIEAKALLHQSESEYLHAIGQLEQTD